VETLHYQFCSIYRVGESSVDAVSILCCHINGRRVQQEASERFYTLKTCFMPLFLMCRERERVIQVIYFNFLMYLYKHIHTRSGRNTWRFCETVVNGTVGVGKFVLERFSSETQSISVAMERWSVELRAFAVETYFKNNDSLLTQKIFRRHFNIHGNDCP